MYVVGHMNPTKNKKCKWNTKNTMFRGIADLLNYYQEVDDQYKLDTENARESPMLMKVITSWVSV